MATRRALLAGRWYPASPDACAREIDAYVGEGSGRAAGAIGPHAGWTFSGDCAGAGYRAIRGHRDAELVVVFGSHRGPRGPSTAFVADAWETPLGDLETDPLAASVRDELELEEEPVRPARPDNAVELHLPFVRRVFGRARLLMLGVEASVRALTIGRRVGEMVRAAGRDAVFVGSTDLTHYGPNYGWAPRGTGDDAVAWVRDVNDAGFLDALEQDDCRGALAHATEHQSACCPGAAIATVEAVRAYAGGVSPRVVSHTLSWDVRPDTSFVGYGAVAL